MSEILHMKNVQQINAIFNFNGGVKVDKSKQETIINMGTNNGTVNNSGGGNIQSINNVNQNDSKEIYDLINSLKELINKESFDEEEKESIIDHLEIAEEQLKSGQPKKSRLNTVYKGIQHFIKYIPSGLAHASLIVGNLDELCNKISTFIQ